MKRSNDTTRPRERRKLVPGPPDTVREAYFRQLVARLGNAVQRASRASMEHEANSAVHDAARAALRDYLRGIEDVDRDFVRRLRATVAERALLGSRDAISGVLDSGRTLVNWLVGRMALADLGPAIAERRQEVASWLRSRRSEDSLSAMLPRQQPQRREQELDLYQASLHCCRPILATVIRDLILVELNQHPEGMAVGQHLTEERIVASLRMVWKDRDAFVRGPAELASALVGALLPEPRARRSVGYLLRDMRRREGAL